MQAPQDFLSCVLEEIALEGLDGITTSSLWVRLMNRPHFPIAIDENSEKFLWECVAVHKNIEIYELPSPRATIEIYNRYDIIDSDLGVFVEPKNLKEDIYPLKIIDDGINRGSCATYETRKCITSKIRHCNMLLMSLQQALNEWGDRLVLVASPSCRLIALIGTEHSPLIELSKEAYVALERIGRSRYHGETTHSSYGLLTLKPISSHLNYYLTKLHSKGLITKQKDYLKKSDGKCVVGFLYHLNRYFVLRKTKFDTILQMMADILKDKPHNRESSKVLKNILGLSSATFKKVIHRSNQKWFKYTDVAYSEMHPNASLEERTSSHGYEKTERVVQMVLPYDLDESGENNELEDSSCPVHFDPTRLSIDKPLICQVYYLIERAGHAGLSLRELMKELTLPRLDIRQLCRHLVRIKEATTFMVDKGRQREEKYICSKFENESFSCMNIKEQAERLKQHSDLLNENCTKSRNDNKCQDNSSKHNELGNSYLKNSEDVGKEIDNLSLPHTGGINKKKQYSSTSQITARILKRCNYIIEHLKKIKVTNIFDLYRHIYEIEKDEGYNFKICRKSLFKLLLKLSREEHIKIMKTTLKCSGKVRDLELVCNPMVKSNDENVRAAIEQAKIKLFGSDAHQSSDDNVNISITTQQTETNIASDNKLSLYNRKAYGLLPKFVRAKMLHFLLFYIVHDYEGSGIETYDDIPVVFHNDESWKRFIPPLPEQKRKGWCTLAEIILRLPLSIFMKIVNISYEIPNLGSYLGDKEKQHYLLKYLPSDLQNYLFNGRRYIFSIFAVICNLCNMGLLSLGPKANVKEKERTSIFVHKKIRIKDTTISTPGNIYVNKNIEYETKEYLFDTLKDVETFWIDLENICNSTPLGRHVKQSPTEVLNTASQLVDACESKDFDAVNDSGDLPGDGLGAAGLDSSLFGHLRRNWCWISQTLKPIPERVRIPSVAGTTLQKLIEDAASQKNFPENQKRLCRITKRSFNSPINQLFKNTYTNYSTENIEEPPCKKKRISKKKKKKPTTLRQKILTKRKPYYDDKDKAAIQIMEKVRTGWTAQEDSFLLICKATSSFLDPKCKRMVVPFPVIRDLLQERFPQLSADKTSRACQRRLRFMLQNLDTKNSVSAFLIEAMQDSELVKSFDIFKPPKTNEQTWKNMFINLFHKLLERLTTKSTSSGTSITLPNDFELLHEHYKIFCPKIQTGSGFKHYEPRCLDDIYREVIHDLILLALSASVDNRNWSYHLFRLYDQWPEAMLKSVMEELSKEFLITKGRRNRVGHIHVSRLPVRFSITYENSFLTKYPAVVFEGAKDLLEKLAFMPSYQLTGDSPIGYTPVLITLSLMKQVEFSIKIPEQLIVFNSSQTSKKVIEDIEKCNDDSGQLMRLCNITSSSHVSNIQGSSKENNEKEIKENDEPVLLQNKLPNLKDMDTDEISKQSKVVDIENAADLSKMDCDNLNDFLLHDTNLESNEVINESGNHKTSRLALNMLRQESSMPKIEQSEHSHDCIALNACQFLCGKKDNSDTCVQIVMNPDKLINKTDNTKTSVHSYDTKENTLDEETIIEAIKFYLSYVPQTMFSFTNFSDILHKAYENHSSEILKDAEQIFKYIYGTKYNGITHKELWTKFEDLQSFSIDDHLVVLLKSMLVIRVGTISFRYVCVNNAKHWLICSSVTKPSIVSKYQQISTLQNVENEVSDVLNSIIQRCGGSLGFDTNVKDKKQTDPSIGLSVPHYFAPRVWRMPDGSLNKVSLIKYLRTILSYILSLPGVSEQNVCDRFSYILSPIQTLELLELLLKINCIFKYYVRHFKPKSIFSPIRNSCITTTPKPEDETHYEPYVDAIIKIVFFETTLFNE